jgi:hypothetical protein
VKVITCATNLPEHVGQVGTFLRHHARSRLIGVFLDPGICQVLEVEVIEQHPPESVGDNLSKPKFLRVRFT